MLHTAGEELVIDHFAGERSQPPSPWLVGLYHTDDDLADDATIAAVTTEPDYDGPNEVTWPGDIGVETLAEENGPGIRLLDIQVSVEYDISTATEVVDGYFVAADFQSDVLGQASPHRNLVWSHRLDQAYDLEEEGDTFPLVGAQFGID